MNTQLHIPEPCSQDWNLMTPQGNGRHCAQCCKIVVDFSVMEPEEIARYFQRHREEKICGRFRAAQLRTPLPFPEEEYVQRVALAPLNPLQKTAVLALLAFGLLLTACNSTPERPSTEKAAISAPAPVPLPAADKETSVLLGDTTLLPCPAPQEEKSATQEKKKEKKKRRPGQPEGIGPNPPDVDMVMGLPAELPPQPVIVPTPDSSHR